MLTNDSRRPSGKQKKYCAQKARGKCQKVIIETHCGRMRTFRLKVSELEVFQYFLGFEK